MDAFVLLPRIPCRKPGIVRLLWHFVGDTHGQEEGWTVAVLRAQRQAKPEQDGS